MRFFWIVYGLTAIAGTAGVYIAAPMARPLMASLFRKEAAAPVGEDARQKPAAVLKAVPSRAKIPAGQTPSPSESGAPQQAATAILAEPSEEVSPALNGIYLAQHGERPGWGITRHQAPYYALDGARLGHVDGGVLLEYRKLQNSSKGGMVECVMLETETASAPCLVSAKEVLLFTGSYKKLSAKQLADLQAYYALSGKIALRKKELLAQSATMNPYFTALNASYQVLMTNIEKANKLVAQRDQATELQKMRIEDQLREMKVQETRLRAEYDALNAKFRAWKQQHVDELPDPAKDPDVIKWSQQMAELRPRVPGLAY